MSETESPFPKTTVYHSTLVAAGTVQVLITNDPQPTKFKKENQHGTWIGFKYTYNGKSKDHQLTIENQRVHDKLKGLKGHMVQLTASGSREEADVIVDDVAQPGSSVVTKARAAQPPAANGAPPDADTLRAAKRSLMQHVNAQLMAMEAVLLMSDEWDKRHPETPMNEAIFEHFASNFYIGLDRKGLIDGLSHKIEPRHVPESKPAPPPPKPEPPAPALDDDEIPL